MALAQIKKGKTEELGLSSSQLDSITKIRRDYMENMKWLTEHFDDLQKKYGEQYVAVFDKEPVGHSDDLSELIGELSGKHVDLRSVAIQKLSSKTEQLFLTSFAFHGTI